MILQLIMLKMLFLFTPVKNDNTITKSIYDFKVQAANGSTIDFSNYKGKKILIVNTSAMADNNPQYDALEALSKKYQDKLVIIGFLNDDFAQAPGSNKASLAKIEKHYNVTFPLAAQIPVRGENMSPVFKWLTEKQYNNFKDNEVKWDFQKYLINEKGELVAIFDPKVSPSAPQIAAAIDK